MLEKPTKLVNGNKIFIFTFRKRIAKIDLSKFISYKTKGKKVFKLQSTVEDDRNGNKEEFKMRLFYIKANKHI